MKKTYLSPQVEDVQLDALMQTYLSLDAVSNMQEGIGD